MYTRTYPSSGTICEVIPRLWIRCIDVVCRRRRVLEVAGGIESVGLGPKFRVAVNSPRMCSDLMLQAELCIDLPPVQNCNTSLWNKVAFIPIILTGSMRHPELVNRPPSQNFFDQTSYIWQAFLIFPGRQSFHPNHSIKLFLCPFLHPLKQHHT
jgi:hypothetical protein